MSARGESFENSSMLLSYCVKMMAWYPVFQIAI